MDNLIGGTVQYIFSTPLILGIIIGFVLRNPFQLTGGLLKMLVFSSVFITLFLLVRTDGSKAVSPEYYAEPRNQEKVVRTFSNTVVNIFKKAGSYASEIDWSDPKAFFRQALENNSPEELKNKIVPLADDIRRTSREAGKELVPTMQKFGHAAKPWVIEAQKTLREEMARHRNFVEDYEG